VQKSTAGLFPEPLAGFVLDPFPWLCLLGYLDCPPLADELS
jgi:hypothetical protein